MKKTSGSNPDPECCRFRVYCTEAEWHYFEIEIYVDKASMLKAHKKFKGTGMPKDTGAIFSSFGIIRVKGKTQRKLGVLGRIFFHFGQLNIGTVVHEFQHALLNWIEVSRIDIHEITYGQRDKSEACGDEERICYTVGRMIESFYNRLEKEGYYTRAVIHPRRYKIA